MQFLVWELVSSPYTLTALQQSVANVPELGVAHFYLSKCYLHQNKPEKARESYMRAVGLDENLRDTDYWIDIQEALCRSLMKNGRFDACIGLCEKVLQKIEEEKAVISDFGYVRHKSRVLVLLGDIYLALNDMEQAIQLFKKALSIKKAADGGLLQFGIAPIHKKLAKALRAAGNEDEAAVHEKKARQMEKRQEMFSVAITGMGMMFFLWIGQVVFVFLAVIIITICLFYYKQSQKAPASLAEPVRWSFADITRIYLGSFVLPMVVCLVIAAFIVYLGSACTGFATYALFATTGLSLIASSVIFLLHIRNGNQKNFFKVYPDKQWHQKEQFRSFLTVALWQLPVVIIGNLIFMVCLFSVIFSWLF